jgi:predicted 3-demethylubiquinone-9 3-methyltransferase (glyoxalase superfamily)
MHTQKIVPCLWFDNQAEDATKFYTSVFKSSKIEKITRYGASGAEVSGRAEGSVMTVEYQLSGQEFLSLNGGPYFKFTPAISFFVNCETEKEIDEFWEKLSKGGTVMMGLDKYPFSEKFGWVADKFGVSWQLTLASRKQKITPFMMFVKEQHGNAEEAINFYVSLFPDSKVVAIERNEAGGQETEGSVKHATFSLGGQEFMALESNLGHPFTFSPAISLIVNCKTQEEIDRLWAAFTREGQESQCGWLTDKYGVSWQIVPEILDQLVADPDSAKSEKVMKAMLKMKKLDIKALQQAYNES